MFTMYDSVTLSEIPKGPHAVAAYVDGHYANIDQARRDFPHARILGISTGSRVAADCYDIEIGDYHPDEAAALYKIAHDAGISRPCFYANLSTMPAVKQSLQAILTHRDDVRLWVASWDGVTVIPGDYDAKQFTDRALGRNLDESICKDDFFAPDVDTPPAPHVPQDVIAATVTFDPGSQGWQIHSAPAPVDHV